MPIRSPMGTRLIPELKVVVRLSAPAALAQFGFMLTGVVDTLMVSRVGVSELAASGLGTTWQWIWVAFGLGLVMGIDPLISQAHGRGDHTQTGLVLQRGIVVALLVSVPLCVGVYFTEPGLLLLQQEPQIAQKAGLYNLWKLPTVPCFLVYTALRQYLQARSVMAPAAWVMWIGNLLNVVLNWALIFGHLGCSPLGLVGAAMASSLTMLFLVLGLAGWIAFFKLHQGAWEPWQRKVFNASGLWQIIRLGAPVGGQIALESTAFGLSTLMAGWLGTKAVASHQIVLGLAALSFMVPLGVSQGAATRVGNRIGAEDEQGMLAATWASVFLGVGVMAISAVLFFAFKTALPRLYTADRELIQQAAKVLPIAAAFQLSDGAQVVSGGVLRGMGRPDAAMIVNLIGYYFAALPLGYYLAFTCATGLAGVWTALAIGLTAVAVSLLYWVHRTSKLPLSKLRVAVTK